MNKDEHCLIKWFWEKFNSCYLVKHEDYQESIFMFYDPQYIRKLKLANISGEKIKPKIDITGICLFEQDWKNMNFRCNYKEVWDYLQVAGTHKNEFTNTDSHTHHINMGVAGTHKNEFTNTHCF